MTDPVMERLFHDAATHQHDLLSAMADRCEELGDARGATGYRWMRDNHRWPERHIQIVRASDRTPKIAVPHGWRWFPLRDHDDTPLSSYLPINDADDYWIKNKRDWWATSIDEVLQTAAEALGKWLEETSGDPCSLCDGTGGTWKYDHANSYSRVKVTCKDCDGKQRRQPKQRQKKGAKQ